MTDVAAPLESTVTETAPVSSGDVLASLTAEQRGAWLKTGDLPGSDIDSAPDATVTNPPPTTETKPKTGSPRHDINARLGQLSEQKRIEAARADAAERKIAELEARLSAPAGTVTETTTAEVATVQTSPRVYQTPRGPVDFGSDDPSKIVDQFIALGYDDPYAAMNLFTPRATLHFAEQDRQTQTAQARDQQLVDEAFAEVAEKYPGWSMDRLRTPEMQFPIPPTTARLIFESPVRADVINYFSEHPAEGRAIAAMDPLAAARALGALESTLSAVSSPSATRKTVSTAPPPSQSLGSRHQSGAGDDLDEAIRTNDTRRYIDLANQRELAERRGARR